MDAKVYFLKRFKEISKREKSAGDLGMKLKVRLYHYHLGRKAMTNLDSVLKGRGVTLPTKVLIVKAMVFPVVMYGCRIGPKRRLRAKEFMLSNSGAGEDS